MEKWSLSTSSGSTDLISTGYMENKVRLQFCLKCSHLCVLDKRENEYGIQIVQ